MDAVCATLADRHDFETLGRGEAHLDVLCGFSAFHPGAPFADWLAALMNRSDGELVSACFSARVAEAVPDRPDRAAIDGKGVRRSHDHARERGPSRLLSSFAAKSRLALGREAVQDKLHALHRAPARP